MFAFAIYDSRINKLLICRDYIGIKTLYYHPIDNGIVFASEVKAIIASSFYKPYINKFQLPNFFFNRSVYGGETMFLNVFKLLPGHFIEYDLKKFCFKINSFTPEYLKKDFKKEKLEKLLSKEIRSHLQADCDVSLALSGGIDSSIIAYYASLDKRKISTFNIKSLSEFDESIYAESISKLIKSKHFSVLLKSESIIKCFDKWALYNDDPIGDPSALGVFLLCQEVNKNGFKVLLSGEGADELFVGYNSYIRYFVFRFLCLLPNSNRIIKIFSNLIKDSRLKDHLFLKDTQNFPYFLGTSHNISIENLSKLFCDSKKALNTIFNFIQKSYKNPKNLFSALYYDQEFRLSNDLLVRADKASMAHSVEIRVPFLSLKLLSYSRNIIFSKFISFLPMLNKIMLKKISYKLFGFFFTFRPKNGFDLPVDKWIYFLTNKSAKIYFKDSYFKDTLNYIF